MTGRHRHFSYFYLGCRNTAAGLSINIKIRQTASIIYPKIYFAWHTMVLPADIFLKALNLFTWACRITLTRKAGRGKNQHSGIAVIHEIRLW